MSIALRRLLFLALTLQAGMACALTLPSVPIGGRLVVVFSLSQAGLPPIANLNITMSTSPAGCGTFDGASTRQVTTNSSGVATFTMDAANRVGQCTIVGTANGTSASGATWVYDPAQVTLEVQRPVASTYVNSSATFEYTVRAAGHPLYGLLASADPLPLSGASGTLQSPQGTSEAGTGFLGIQTNGVPGIYDTVLRVAGKSSPLRVWQQASPPNRPSSPRGREYRAYSFLDGSSIKLSVVAGASQCLFESGEYFSGDTDLDNPPAGTLGWVQGRFQYRLSGCTGSTQLSIEYPQSLPADAVLLLANNIRVPATVNGRTVSYTVTDGSNIDSQPEVPGGLFMSGGVARPGQFPTPRAHPNVKGMWWSGAVENGWGMSVAQSTSPTNNLFAVIYAYDAQGLPTWWVVPGGFWDGQHVGFKSEVYWPYGTPYFAYRGGFTVVGPSVGPIAFQFQDASSGRMDFTIDGITASKTLQQQAFGIAGTVARPDVGGLWYGGASESGWGISVAQQQDTLFSVWYTYDAANHPTWFVMPGGQWTSANTYEGRMYRTRGSPWLGRAYDASQLRVTDVGPYRFRFNGGAATFEYQVDGVGGGLNMQRNTPF